MEHELLKSGFSGFKPSGGGGGIITDVAVVGEAKKPANVSGGGGGGGGGGKKSQQPIAFDIAAMIDAIQVYIILMLLRA